VPIVVAETSEEGSLRTTPAFLSATALLLAGCASHTVAPPAVVTGRAVPKPLPTPTSTSAPAAGIPEIESVPKDPASLAELWAGALKARAEGHHDEALRLWEIVWRADPGYEGVAGRREEEYRVRGLDAFARGHTAEAVELWEKALRIDPEDHKTQAYLSHARAQETRLGEIPTGGSARD
jgi:tetratricopeptide (TPR) repeat protein